MRFRWVARAAAAILCLAALLGSQAVPTARTGGGAPLGGRALEEPPLAEPPLTEHPLLILPFQNHSGDENLDWIGESFSIALDAALRADGRDPLTRAERAAAFDQAGVPQTGALSQATLITIANNVDAAWLVTGSFDYTPAAAAHAGTVAAPTSGQTGSPADAAAAGPSGDLTVNAEVFNLVGEHMSRVRVGPRPLAELRNLEAELAFRVVQSVDPDTALTLAQLRARRQQVSLPAYESYIRGLMAPEPERQVNFFLQAARLQPNFSSAIFQAGKWYFENQDYQTALLWLPRVRADDPDYAQALFLAGEAAYDQRQYDRAADYDQRLAALLPLPQVLSNWGLAETRRGDKQSLDLLGRAVAEDPDYAAARANLAAAECRFGQRREALAAARQAATRTTDPDLLRALAAFETALGRPGASCPGGRAARAGRALETLATDFPAESFHQLAAAIVGFNAAKAATLPSGDQLDFHLGQGEALLGKGALEAAQKEFQAALALNAKSPAAHIGLARLDVARQDWAAAAAQLAVLRALAPHDPELAKLTATVNRHHH